MEKSAFSPSKKEASGSEDKHGEESDSNWSDINSSDEAGDDGERSLRIDIRDDEETEIPTTNTQQPGVPKSPTRRHSLVPFTATSGSSKKSKMYVNYLRNSDQFFDILIYF